MKEKDLFSFVNIEKAIALQRELSGLVKCVDDPGFNPRFLCGLDVAYETGTAFVAAAVWDAKFRSIVETANLVDKVATEYVPGFLGFREGPLLIAITRRIRAKPDAFLIDGQGIAHPRGFGLASHVGVALEKPSIGVAKSRLYGRVEGDRITKDGEVIGRVLLSETGKRYYVSVGHKVSLDTALKLVQGCTIEGFVVPLRRAHLESLLLKRNSGA